MARATKEKKYVCNQCGSHDVVEEVTFQKGDRFSGIGLSPAEVYLLAQVDSTRVCLISLSDGNRWRDPVSVVSPRAITKSEMRKIVDNKYFDVTLNNVERREN